MSELRKQLRAMKAEYESAKYPGDLAYELLARRRPIGRIVAWTTIAGGIAAAIVIWVMHGSIIVQPGPGKPTVVVTNVTPTEIAPSVVAPTTSSTVDTSVVPVTTLASVPEFPEDTSFVPSGGSLVPSATSLDIGSMPSFPSLDWNDVNSSTTKTSKESA